MTSMRTCINSVCTLLILTFCWQTAAKTTGKKPAIKPLDYPELQVSPLASERLKLESGEEGGRKWSNSLYFQLSALATLTSALTASTTDTDTAELDDAKTVGLLVGAGWLVGNTALLLAYTPYSDSLEEINALPKKTKRQRITRERLAEEKIQSADSLISKLKWISFFTNFGASTYIAFHATNSSLAIAAVAGVMSLTPILFEHRWEKVHRQHQIYKKRIYAPVAGPGLLYDHEQRKYVPGISLAYSF